MVIGGTVHRNDFQEIALAAVETYKLLASELDTKLLTLLKRQKINWDSVEMTVSEGTSLWSDLNKERVESRTLRDAVDSTISGMTRASLFKNIEMLQFVAQIDLDLVDLLEGYFEVK